MYKISSVTKNTINPESQVLWIYESIKFTVELSRFLFSVARLKRLISFHSLDASAIVTLPTFATTLLESLFFHPRPLFSRKVLFICTLENVYTVLFCSPCKNFRTIVVNDIETFFLFYLFSFHPKICFTFCLVATHFSVLCFLYAFIAKLKSLRAVGNCSKIE